MTASFVITIAYNHWVASIGLSVIWAFIPNWLTQDVTIRVGGEYT